jgi:hypothetical protein
LPNGPKSSSEVDAMIGTLADWGARFAAHLARRSPTIPAGDTSAGTSSFRLQDWSAFVTRFAGDDGIDYRNFQRVQRLLREHLSRLSDARPDQFASTDERLAFYLNAYNAVTVYEVLRRYPVHSIYAIPAAFARPYPIGPENLTLHHLHTKIRAFGDPRVHAAITSAMSSGPRLRAYSGATLQQDLDQQMRDLLARSHVHDQGPGGSRRVLISPIFHRYAGDFAEPQHMPGLRPLVRGWLDPSRGLPFLRRYVPEHLEELVVAGKVDYLPFDWSLNDSSRG